MHEETSLSDEKKCSGGKCGYGESCDYCKSILEGWMKEWKKKQN